MRLTRLAGLIGCIAVALPLVAQVPRDPLAADPAKLRGANAGGAAAAPQLPAPFVTKQTEVEIPFTVRTGTTADSQPSAVRVFVSWDKGVGWHFYEELKPEAARFRFKARQDGEYWFATQTIDRAGRADSPQPRTPQLRLVIDSQRPQLVVQTQVDASANVNLSWSAFDATLQAGSLKVEYQDAADSSGAWQAVDLGTPGAAAAGGQVSGQCVFHPAISSRTIVLRAEIADGAGNVAYFSQRLALTPTAPAVASGRPVAPAPDPSATAWLPDRAAPGAVVGSSTALASNAVQASDISEQVVIPNAVENPFVSRGRLASASRAEPKGEELPLPGVSGAAEPAMQPAGPVPGDPPAGELPLPSAAPPNERPPQPTTPSFVPRAQANQDFVPLGRTPDAGQEELPLAPSLVGPRNVIDRPEAMPPPGEALETPSGSRPRLTNSRRFSLDYDVQSVGPEGLAGVELWGTTNGGRSWVKWGADPDKASPFDVEVNHEAIYGFRIVIIGKNGLATSTPQAGDAADIWVGVDLTRPQARLTGAAYGEGDTAGKLDVRWEAGDDNLGSRPVTLSIADRPDGTFAPIAAGLPNSGQYYWEFDPRSPRQIYLRLEIRDEAGNIAIDQLTEPIKVDGLEPKGRIKNFSPGPESIRGAFRPPLFR